LKISGNLRKIQGGNFARIHRQVTNGLGGKFAPDYASVEKPKQSLEFAYTGLLKCDHCGCSITAELKKNRYSYYHCTGYKGKHGEPNVREEKLSEQFSGMLKDLFVDDDIADWILGTLETSTRDTKVNLEETRARLTSQREKLSRRSEVLYDDRLDGRITTSRFDLKEAEIRRELELVEEKLASLENASLQDPLEHARGILA
jgi:site-specific DNA recombinase